MLFNMDAETYEMAPQSIFQYYKSEQGLDTCEVALRPLAKAAA